MSKETEDCNEKKWAKLFGGLLLVMIILGCCILLSESYKSSCSSLFNADFCKNNSFDRIVIAEKSIRAYQTTTDSIRLAVSWRIYKDGENYKLIRTENRGGKIKNRKWPLEDMEYFFIYIKDDSIPNFQLIEKKIINKTKVSLPDSCEIVEL